MMTSLVVMSLARYKAALQSRVRRHKQALIAAILLLAPGMPALMALTMGPLERIFSDSGSEASTLSSLGFALFSLAWIGLQRDLLEDGEAAPVIKSLPFSAMQMLAKDLAVLATASSPWFVLLCVSCALSIIKHGGLSAIPLYVIVIMGSLGAQLAWIRGRTAWVLLFLLILSGASWYGITSLTLGGIALVACLLTQLPDTTRRLPGNSLPLSRNGLRMPGGPWFSLYCQTLFHARHEGYRGSAPLLAGMALTVMAILLFGSGHGAARIGLIVMFSGLASIVSSGGFATLLTTSQTYSSLLDSLPASRHSRKTSAVMAVTWPSIALSTLLALTACFVGRDAWPALFAPMICIVYGFAQRHMHDRMPKEVVVANLVLACMSLGMGIWLMTRSA